MKRDRVTYPRETLKLYWEQVRTDKRGFWLMAIGIPLSAIIFDTIVPYYLSQAIGTFTNRDTHDMHVFIVLAAVAAFVGLIVNVIGYQSSARHESLVRSRLIESTLSRLFQKDAGYFANQKVGALTSRLVDFVDSHIDLQVLVFMKTIPFVLNTVFGLVLIATASPIVALLALALIAGILVQVRISKRIREPYRAKRKKLRGETHGLIADAISNNQTVTVFAKETEELDMVRNLNASFRRAYIKDFSMLNIDGTLRLLVMNGVQILAIVLIAGMLYKGAIPLGIAIFTLTYLQRFATQLFELGTILVGYDTIFMAAAPITEALLEEPLIADKPQARKLGATKGAIRFSNVSYYYRDNDQTAAVSDLTLDIKPGQRVGVVGYSGAGKTTLTKLLLRFDDVTSGSIQIDGQDIRDVTQQSLRDAIAYVQQEPLLFHRTLGENIAYARWSAGKKDIEFAAKQAHAMEFISKLPQGMNTIVGERGIKLSGGQRQRIAIARAILKDAPILILDEATSALDSESEKLIQAGLDELMRNRTSIVIAHRLSTIAKLDRIIVLDQGRVVEDGPHAELLQRKGIYARLWSHQSGGFIEE